MVGGSPCQDFSVAGKQKGAVWTCTDCGYKYNPLEAHFTERDKCPKCHSEHIEKTRSSLLVEWLRILRAKKPNFAMYENVKNIVGKQFKPTFDLFEKELYEYGYNTYWKILNAKNYGIPQNRERVYLIVIKKEIDNGKFKFPQSFDNGVRLKDLLEDNVYERYYLSDKRVTYISNRPKNYECKINPNTSNCLRTNYGNASANECYIRDEKGVRKFTPKECFKLMGFSNEDFQKAKSTGISNTQLYKQTGNSIVVDVLYYILLELYKAMPYLFDDIKVSSFFSGIGAFEKALNRLYKYIIKK